LQTLDRFIKESGRIRMRFVGWVGADSSLPPPGSRLGGGGVNREKEERAGHGNLSLSPETTNVNCI
jgi:hypothetical protein